MKQTTKEKDLVIYEKHMWTVIDINGKWAKLLRVCGFKDENGNKISNRKVNEKVQKNTKLASSYKPARVLTKTACVDLLINYSNIVLQK